MTQNKMILLHLLSGSTITQQTASLRYGVGRLASRAHDLNKLGMDVRSRNIQVRKASGRLTYVSEYYIPHRTERKKKVCLEMK